MSKNSQALEAERLMIERAQQNSAVFGEIFDMYYKTILTYVARRTGNIAIAQDITSDVFMKALDNLPKFQWQGISISAWLYKIAMNELRMYYRKTRYTASLDEMQEKDGFEPVDERDIAAELQNAQALVEQHAQFLTAQSLISQLPLKYQEVLSLRFGERKKMSEIAQILGKREGTVKSLLSRALKRLRSQMEYSKTQLDSKNRITASEGQTTIKPQDEL